MLKAIPTAKYDAACQSSLEASRGVEEMPTL
jgi:hypothetical protein